MLVIATGLHPNRFFKVENLYVESNIHSVALHLFAVQEMPSFGIFPDTAGQRSC